jgi:hypothetical protein
MKRQEDAYKVLDYLNPAHCAESAGLDDALRGRTNKNIPADTAAAKLHLTEFPPTLTRTNRQKNNNCSSAGVSEEWRTKICEWSCKSSGFSLPFIIIYRIESIFYVGFTTRLGRIYLIIPLLP